MHWRNSDFEALGNTNESLDEILRRIDVPAHIFEEDSKVTVKKSFKHESNTYDIFIKKAHVNDGSFFVVYLLPVQQDLLEDKNDELMKIVSSLEDEKLIATGVVTGDVSTEGVVAALKQGSMLNEQSSAAQLEDLKIKSSIIIK